ncbi:hypothetical protein DL96DRAFT_1619182 [Flagelloscypha sp. PMI_526]|nr:hypothetical protein DL96DRAFT_1619182 [Flagelloscypha sp. PMI_526]
MDEFGQSTIGDESEPTTPIPHFIAKRHTTCGNLRRTTGDEQPADGPPWRHPTPGKLKTAYAALVMCLNIDIDPPDNIKTNPCAVLECWVNPQTMPASNATNTISANITHQFESLSVKVHYKSVMDPSFDDLRKNLEVARRTAKDDAVVVYYNGHGVPKPTASGELWCFNRNYTQYIPVSLQEVQSWVGSPGVYIWDCSAAGNLLENFKLFAERRDQELRSFTHGPNTTTPFMNSLQLAACMAHESLPSCPELPADLFTSCLTSPIDMALRYFVMKNQLPHSVQPDQVMQLPGDLKDRRTPLGELNWIFTAITDTIAWTTFSKELFARLYRCDLLIASLFRNFLLAERIMKDFNCTPYTYPPLPSTNTHPLWATWDLAVDACMRQLPGLLPHNSPRPSVPPLQSASAANGPFATRGRTPTSTSSTPSQAAPLPAPSRVQQMLGSPTPSRPYTYVPNRFFADQLTAFEVWISRGGAALTKRGPMSQPDADGDTPASTLVPRKPPEQLAIVLQVLLSQPHRLRALILLSQFVDLGAWAVNLVLDIGIFPYISKLLQAPGPDLRPVLIFIWARILAVDPTVQMDLYHNAGYKYFANVLSLNEDAALPNVSEHKAMCSFILAAVARDFPHGQQACLDTFVFDNCFERLDEPDFLLRQWTALCISQIWDANDAIKVYGVDRGVQDKLIALLSDDSSDVRAAALYALATFLGASGSLDPKKRGGGGSGSMHQLEERVHFRMEVAVATEATLAIKDDASPMCRKELLIVLSCLVKEWRGYFVICAWIYWEEDTRWRNPDVLDIDEDITGNAILEWLDNLDVPIGTSEEKYREESRVLLSSFFTMFVALLDLSADPYPEVSNMATTIVDYIMALLLDSPFMKLSHTALVNPPYAPDGHLTAQVGQTTGGGMTNGTRSRKSSVTNSPTFPPLSPRPAMLRSETDQGLRRTSSFASALRSFAGNIAFPHVEEPESGRNSPTPSTISTTRHSMYATQPPASLASTTALVDSTLPPPPALESFEYVSPYPHTTISPHTLSFVSSNPGEPPSPKGSYFNSDGSEQSSNMFDPCDAMEALIQEDILRLRARRKRRKTAHHYHGPNGSGSHNGGSGLPSPAESTFSTDSIIQGMGTGGGMRDVLPLKSTYFDWCAEYFQEPQMRQAENDEAGSIEYNYQMWRHQRNEQMLNQTKTQAAVAEERKWDRPVATLLVPPNPLTLVFHSFDKHLITANEHDLITVTDWSTKKRMSQFHNGNCLGTSITSLHIINEEQGGFIMTGASDGVLRMYRNYDPTLEHGSVELVTAFRAMHETVSLPDGSGMLLDWLQASGTIFVAGDSHVIKTWDAQTETQALDLDTNAGSPVTAIKSDYGGSQLFVAGFGSGDVRVFDRRMEEDNAIVRTYDDAHSAWVQNVRWHPTRTEQFLSASLDGSVKLWDLRSTNKPYFSSIWEPFGGLSAFDVHPQAPIMAASSPVTPTSYRSQRAIVRPVGREDVLSSYPISTGLTAPPQVVSFPPYQSSTHSSLASSVSSTSTYAGPTFHLKYPSPVIPRMTSTVFHPLEMLVGFGEPDGTIRIYGCKIP